MSARRKPSRTVRSVASDAGSSVRESVAPVEATPPPLIVSIGASAGGLEAYKAFFDHMPAEGEMAFVLVQHLAPDHASLLVDLIARHTSLTVVEATDGLPVEARHVYIIPPDATLTITDGVLQLSKPAPPRQYRRPIDTFFQSLAEDQGDNAVAIVLSGSGSDGALGLRAVKERGGLTLAQAGIDHHVAMSGMPSSAVATGLVDHVLAVEEMPQHLLNHHRHLLATRSRKGPDGARQDLSMHLQTICGLLRAEVGHDFGQYKEKTLVRRIQRRMVVAQTDTVPDYIEYLRRNPRELEELFRELLIGVTEFFRDPEAFAVLQEQAIPTLLADKDASDLLRVWVPACATGEEAYSIAIALAEAVTSRRGGPKVQIFATDIDDRAIAIARSGRFRGPLQGVSPERLERWFTQDGDHYCAIKPIREMIVFSPHSAIKDPPFSRLDLITCRNLLIYLNSDLQDQVIRTFHYALRPGGVLMLGSSESLGRNTSLFSVLDKKHRLYVRRNDGATVLPVPPPRRLAGIDTASRSFVSKAAAPEDAIDRNARKVVERHLPAYVVIDANHDVLRFSGDTGRYLGPSSGTASLNLFALLHKGLRAPARTAVQQAFARQDTVTQEGQLANARGERIPVRLIAEPIPEQDGDGDKRSASLCLLMFKELPPSGAATTESPPAKARSARGEGARIAELELELSTTREQLHTAIDELETANEEMKSANEEYQSVNEELQSSNEELETSKEEMQSINEELQTVNVELNSKNEALARLNSDLQNLLESTQIATLFLDSSLHVSGFTPAIGDLFHLRESDRGRPITEITARIPYPQLKQDVKQVLRTLAMVERVLHDGPDGGVFLLRMRPYRTTDNVIDGVVLTFIDITERQQHEYERARLASIVESSQDAILSHNDAGTITSWNQGAEQIFGYPAARVIGKSIAMLLPPDQQDLLAVLLAASSGDARADEMEMRWLREDGSQVPVSVRCSPVRDQNGVVIGGSAVVRDISQRNRAARKLAESQRRLAAIVAQTTVGVAEFDFDGRCSLANPRFCEILGQPEAQLRQMRLHELVHPEDVADLMAAFATLVANGTPYQGELRYRTANGAVLWMSQHMSMIQDDDGKPASAVVVALDITQAKLAADHRELLLRELDHRVKNTLATVQAIALQTMAHRSDIASFREVFLARLEALTNTHNLLARESWRGVELREVVQVELAPYTLADRVPPRIEGSALRLDPKTAVALSLALHELATNAAKYGALSSDQGRVQVSWKVEEREGRRWLHLYWTEQDGPEVRSPDRVGFGSRLIRDGIAHELGGHVSLDFPVTGAVCTIDIPLSEGDRDA